MDKQNKCKHTTESHILIQKDNIDTYSHMDDLQKHALSRRIKKKSHIFYDSIYTKISRKHKFIKTESDQWFPRAEVGVVS